jgi:hypothetical protein
MLTAEEHRVALLNLAVPSPIFRDTEPILVLPSSTSTPKIEESDEGSVRVRFVKWKKTKGLKNEFVIKIKIRDQCKLRQ